MDLDDDGWTFEEGDCDDFDPSTYPGALELCDGWDNNCDGIDDVEFFGDRYELNEDIHSAYDVGEIDSSWSWGVSSLTIEDLNFDHPYDADWFKWDADDDWWDDADVSVEAVGSDEDLYIYVSLWVVEWDSSRPIAEGEGFGTVTLDEDDFYFDEDDESFWDTTWDTWYVVVEPDPYLWTEETCMYETYELTIES